MNNSTPLAIDRVLETSLCAPDLDAVEPFYRDVLGANRSVDCLAAGRVLALCPRPGRQQCGTGDAVDLASTHGRGKASGLMRGAVPQPSFIAPPYSRSAGTA